MPIGITNPKNKGANLKPAKHRSRFVRMLMASNTKPYSTKIPRIIPIQERVSLSENTAKFCPIKRKKYKSI
tara:strand:- start:104 stop:316 length:213 start_codon:yes stop_codon:yes gene_type:complete